MTSQNKPRHNWQFEAIGTSWSIETAEPLGEIQQVIGERIESFDRTYSRFRDDSLVYAVGQNAGEYHFPADARKIIELYRRLYEVTDGAVSPLIGSTLSEAGYNKNYSFEETEIHDVPKWDDVMTWDGISVTTKTPALLDFGAAGKGYLIDIIANILDQNRVTEYVIDGSGDVRIRGVTQQIGLENPHDYESVIGVAQVENASLCASATNRRSWGKWHHVVDAKTAKPTDDIVATWVVMDDAMVADGLATALFFVGPEKLGDWQFEYVRLDKYGHIEKSPGFVGELFA